jgi:hypothetical protein
LTSLNHEGTKNTKDARRTEDFFFIVIFAELRVFVVAVRRRCMFVAPTYGGW